MELEGGLRRLSTSYLVLTSTDDIDEYTRNYSTLHAMLPRESNSKEVDAALLSVIGFPAFAVNDADLINVTRDEIVKKVIWLNQIQSFAANMDSKDSFGTVIKRS